MKNLYKLFGIIVIAAVIGFSFTVCEQSTPDNDDITYTAAADSTANTTAINFTFSGSVSGLTAADITVADDTGSVTKGALTGSGTSWSLAVTVATAGNVTVSINKSGIEAAAKTVAVYKTGQTVITYTVAETGGADGTADSTGIVFTFSASVDSLNLTAADITVGGAAEKDDEASLSGTGTTRTLPITVSAAGLATVSINKSGIEAATKTVTVHKEGQATPWSITWNLNGGEKGTGAYPEQIEKGEVLAQPSPDPTKDGFTFDNWYTDESLTTAYNFTNTVTANLILYAKWVEAGSDITYTAAANGNSTATTTAITLTFSAAVTGLTANDITITNGTGSATKGGLIGSSGTTWSLTVTVVTAGNVTVSINKAGIESGSKTVAVYKAAVSITREVTIAMWDYGSSGTGDGWDDSAALRINVNGTNLATNARLASGRGPGYYRFDVNPGDVVQIYWVNGGTYDRECAFAAYYTDDPPSPMFDPSSGTTDTARVLASKQYNQPSGAVGDGTSMGSFTVPGGDVITPDTITYTATANGNNATDTTAITLTFSEAVTGLTASDITITNGTGSATKGGLIGSSGTTWSLTVTVVTAGDVTVSINKDGIESGSKPVTVYKAASVSGGSMDDAIELTENEWADGNIPTSDDVQWFSFIATASTQNIHAAFGTLTDLYVQVYDSGGAEVGNQSYLYSSGTRASRSLTNGQTYYIRVKPYGSSNSGTYRIGFNTSIAPPGVTPIPLTANVWADGNIPSSGDKQQWFSFTATASTHYLHVSFGSLNSYSGMYVQVYNSSGVAAGSRTQLYSSTTNTSLMLSSGQTYYIRVEPYYSSGSGTYRIGFNTSFVPPGVTPIPLTENQWADGSLSIYAQQWFTFTATASTQYIHFSTTGTLKDVYVQVYDSGGATVGSETRLYSSTTNTSRTLTSEQTYYIKVTPYSSSGSGNYRIGFNTSTTATIVPSTAIPLTANVWADGSIPTSDGEQWFTFTATATTQYIHFDNSGTLTRVYVQVYDNSGATVGSQTYLYSTTTSTSRTLNNGQTYYIRVRPYSSSYSGTYQIGFTTSTTAPSFPPANATTLTENIWADGNLPSNHQWFTFTATASIQYIHFSTTGTLKDVYVQVYASNGTTTVGSETNLYGSYTRTSRTLTSGQTYYIRVRPFNSSYSGDYRIVFNTTFYPPGTTFNTLTVNQWANGSIPTSGNGEQWFTFTATATAPTLQYIHAAFGTLTDLYVCVYDSSGTELGSATRLYSSTTSTSRSLTSGQTYYIRVRPYSSSYSGTYRIGFNTSTTAPTS